MLNRPPSTGRCLLRPFTPLNSYPTRRNRSVTLRNNFPTRLRRSQCRSRTLRRWLRRSLLFRCSTLRCRLFLRCRLLLRFRLRLPSVVNRGSSMFLIRGLWSSTRSRSTFPTCRGRERLWIIMPSSTRLSTFPKSFRKNMWVSIFRKFYIPRRVRARGQVLGAS